MTNCSQIAAPIHRTRGVIALNIEIIANNKTCNNVYFEANFIFLIAELCDFVDQIHSVFQLEQLITTCVFVSDTINFIRFLFLRATVDDN
jgi:hypothetical protein